MMQMIQFATHYVKNGWSILPLKPASKQPCIPNGVHGASNNPSQVGDWWTKWPDANIGIACGPVSNGLIVIDIDGPIGEQNLAECEAKLGPLTGAMKAKTSRGRHLYMQSDAYIRSRVPLMEELEVRSRGLYVVGPPSIHPSGTKYTWAVDSPHQPDSLTKAWIDHINSNDAVAPGSSLPTAVQNLSIDEVIHSTIPTGPGQRWRCLFVFVRTLKAMPEYAESEAVDLLPIVRRWHQAAFPYTSKKHDVDDTLSDFVAAWKSAHYAINQGPLAVAWERSQEMSKLAVLRDYGDKLNSLALLCAALQQQHPEKSFFLDSRSVGRICGLSHTRILKYLGLLQELGVLERTKKGSKGKASEYRWVGP